MGTVIRFPEDRRGSCKAMGSPVHAGGSIVILPVVRIERNVDEGPSSVHSGAGAPSSGHRNGRRS